MERYRVARSFKEDGRLIHNDNVESLAPDVLADRVEKGYVVDLRAGRVSHPEGVSFASEQAGKEAAEAGLDASHFENVEPSSDRGYTVADVRSIKED